MFLLWLETLTLETVYISNDLIIITDLFNLVFISI